MRKRDCRDFLPPCLMDNCVGRTGEGLNKRTQWEQSTYSFLVGKIRKLVLLYVTFFGGNPTSLRCSKATPNLESSIGSINWAEHKYLIKFPCQDKGHDIS